MEANAEQNANFGTENFGQFLDWYLPNCFKFFIPKFVILAESFVIIVPYLTSRPCLIYQYSNMALSLLDQNCILFKFLLSLNSQRRLGYKENNTRYRSLS